MIAIWFGKKSMLSSATNEIITSRLQNGRLNEIHDRIDNMASEIIIIIVIKN